jgi:hypothetical protein
MVSVIDIMTSDEFKNSDAVAATMDLLNSTLTYINNGGWNDETLDEADMFDELAYNYKSLSWGCGATKVAVMFRTFVLKSNYSRCASYSYDEDNEEDVREESEWEDCDYCWVESRVYEEAVKAGISQFFAPTIRIGNSDVYIQPKADKVVAYTDWYHLLNGTGYSRYEIRFGEKAFEELRDELGFNRISRAIFSYWLDTTSYVQLKKLGHFLRKHCINDLHNHNIGWFGDKVLLFDYSGYRSGTEYTI